MPWHVQTRTFRGGHARQTQVQKGFQIRGENNSRWGVLNFREARIFREACIFWQKEEEKEVQEKQKEKGLNLPWHI